MKTLHQRMNDCVHAVAAGGEAIENLADGFDLDAEKIKAARQHIEDVTKALDTYERLNSPNRKVGVTR